MDLRISNVYQAYSANTIRNTQRQTRPQSTRTEGDRLSISAQAEDLQNANRIVGQTPDVRQEYVVRIQNMLDQGIYRVSAQEVAASIFRGL